MAGIGEESNLQDVDEENNVGMAEPEIEDAVNAYHQAHAEATELGVLPGVVVPDDSEGSVVKHSEVDGIGGQIRGNFRKSEEEASISRESTLSPLTTKDDTPPRENVDKPAPETKIGKPAPALRMAKPKSLKAHNRAVSWGIEGPPPHLANVEGAKSMQDLWVSSQDASFKISLPSLSNSKTHNRKVSWGIDGPPLHLINSGGDLPTEGNSTVASHDTPLKLNLQSVLLTSPFESEAVSTLRWL